MWVWLLCKNVFHFYVYETANKLMKKIKIAIFIKYSIQFAENMLSAVFPFSIQFGGIFVYFSTFRPNSWHIFSSLAILNIFFIYFSRWEILLPTAQLGFSFWILQMHLLLFVFFTLCCKNFSPENALEFFQFSSSVFFLPPEFRNPAILGHICIFAVFFLHFFSLD